MNQELKVILTAREAAEYLRVSLFTLSKMEKLGMLSPARTPGGHRRYTLEMLNAYLDGGSNHQNANSTSLPGDGSRKETAPTGGNDSPNKVIATPPGTAGRSHDRLSETT
ncbi:MAG: hypothetical protein H5T64_01965 [Chloroflexi bacterium]|nr:hypothetical protein [Chloroflexota bacterium]